MKKRKRGKITWKIAIIVHFTCNPMTTTTDSFLSNTKLSQPQLNHNSTQHNITKVGFDMKMTFL